MSPPSPETISDAPNPIDIVRDILRDAGSLSRLIEVHYLLQEPGLLDIMRGLGTLADDDRDRVRDFLARNQGRLTVRERGTGTLIFEFADKASLDKSA